MTQNQRGNQRDLDALVNAASKEIDQAAERARRAEAATGKPKAIQVVLKSALGIALVVSVMQFSELRRQLFGVSKTTVQTEAAAVLNAARAAVEKHHELTGQWPDRVPLPSLEALVAMQGDGAAYQLTLVLDGGTWKMDQNGTIVGATQ